MKKAEAEQAIVHAHR